jgi:hypothetical protein
MEILTAYCKRYLLPAPQIGFVACAVLLSSSCVLCCALVVRYLLLSLVLFSLALFRCDLTVTVPQLAGLCRVAVIVLRSLLSLLPLRSFVLGLLCSSLFSSVAM